MLLLASEPLARLLLARDAVVVAVSVDEGGAGVVPGLVGDEELEGEPGFAALFAVDAEFGVAAAAAEVEVPAATATGLAM